MVSDNIISPESEEIKNRAPIFLTEEINGIEMDREKGYYRLGKMTLYSGVVNMKGFSMANLKLDNNKKIINYIQENLRNNIIKRKK